MEAMNSVSQLKTKRGVNIIDRVVNEIVLPYSTMPDNKVMLSFARIFKHRGDGLISHYLDKFIGSNRKDFGNYYLSCDLGMIRDIFNHFNIPIEDDKIPDEIGRIKAQLSGKNRFEIFPFECELVRLFYLYANNHSLDNIDHQLNFVGMDKVLSDNKIDRYGNGINWSKAWNCFDHEGKEQFIHFLIYDYK